MGPAAIALAVALANPLPPGGGTVDIDAAERASRVDIESQYLKDQMLAAMAYPYKYRVTQMPCAARELQPQRGWFAAREPSGNIRWIPGQAFKARWTGIYGTCFIESPLDKESVDAASRAALECECNGWLPRQP